jgi:hypothetical protein
MDLVCGYGAGSTLVKDIVFLKIFKISIILYYTVCIFGVKVSIEKQEKTLNK